MFILRFKKINTAGQVEQEASSNAPFFLYSGIWEFRVTIPPRHAAWMGIWRCFCVCF
jgi:hypothetical protein